MQAQNIQSTNLLQDLRQKASIAEGDLLQERALRKTAEGDLLQYIEISRQQAAKIASLESQVASLQQQVLTDRQSFFDLKVHFEQNAKKQMADEAQKASDKNLSEIRRLTDQVNDLGSSNPKLSQEVFQMKKQIQNYEATYSEAKDHIKDLENEIESLQNEVKNEETESELKRLLHLANPAASSSKPGPKTSSGAEFYNIDSDDKNEPAGGDSLPSFFPLGTNGEGIQTPAFSQAEAADFRRGKQVDEKIDIKPWPSIAGFRAWKLAFKKAVAAASRRSKDAFAWISQVENAKTFEELDNSGDMEELDAKLAVELDKILSGEFKKTVQIKEAEYSKLGKMVNGRQITWMIYQNFKLSDIDGALLEWEELLSVELKGDNLQQFLNDWESTCLSFQELPDAKFMETLFRKQLEKSDQLKQTMQLYWQDITQRGEQKSYTKLKSILRLHIERRKLERNQSAYSRKDTKYGNPASGGRSSADSTNPRKGDCRQWAKEGKCSRGGSCPWSDSHTRDKAGKGRGRSPSAKGDRGRSPSKDSKGKGKGKGKSKGRSPSPGKGPPKRGTSPSGKADQPPCFKYLKGNCKDGDDCQYCKFFAKGNCSNGKNCPLMHLKIDKVASAK